VKIGARHVRQRAGDTGPFYIAGYSNGGALAVHYALEALEEPELPAPDRLVLFSPCIGVSAFAAASNWHRILSWMSYFEQSRWLSVEPEFDPYKYNSFPKNAGAQAWDMTQAVQDRLEEVTAQGRLDELPPILAFQSLVDATVIMEELVSRLFDRLPSNGSELVLFDVNRSARTEEFLKADKGAYLARLEARDDQPYRMTVISNVAESSAEVEARTKEAHAGEAAEQPLGLAWPRGVYSLAHVSIPFPDDDPLYGVLVGEPPLDSIHLGSLAPRGEVNILTVSASQFLRLRHNPFHAFMEERVTEVIAVDRGQEDG
jgi:alpha-beta hydrolase superfamily lysophospholipase